MRWPVLFAPVLLEYMIIFRQTTASRLQTGFMVELSKATTCEWMGNNDEPSKNGPWILFRCMGMQVSNILTAGFLVVCALRDNKTSAYRFRFAP